MRPSSSYAGAFVPTLKLTMHEDSRVISKVKPKIRIIHIVAPEIITTDVDHFRELVQKLTGKQAERKRSAKKRTNVSSEVKAPTNMYATKQTKNVDSSAGMPFAMNKMKKEDEETYGMENHSSFLSFLGDVDGFIHEMNEYPLLPFRPAQVNTYGEMHLC